jgi:hypothetical protein
MLIVTFVFLIVIYLTFAESKFHLKNGMFYGFMLLALFFSLRSTSYGNDLATYEGHFNENTWNMLDYLSDKSSAEISWLILNLLFKPLGFRSFVLFNTFLLCGVMYYLIKRFVPSNWRWFAVFIFLFDTNQFLLNLSMLRQSMSISLMALAIVMMYDKKWIISIVISMIAFTVHRTAFIMIPFVLLAIFNNEKITKWAIISVVSLVAVCVFSMDTLTPYLFELLQTDVIQDAYREHLDEIEQTSRGFGMGLILQMLAAIPMLVIWKKMEIFPKKMILMFMFYFLFCFASLYLTLLFRFGYYFILWGNLAYPISYRLIKQRKNLVILNYVSILFLSVCILYTYYDFFVDSVYSKYYSNFQFCF